MKRTANTTTIVHHCNLLVVGCLLFVVSPARAMVVGNEASRPGLRRRKGSHNIDRAIELVRQDWKNFSSLSDDMKDTKEVVLAAVQTRP